MTPLTINRYKVDWPDGYEDLTWGQSKAMLTAKDDVEVISILTGLKPEFWKQFKDVEQFHQLLFKAMEWVSKGPPDTPDLDRYRQFHFNSKQYDFPADVGHIHTRNQQEHGINSRIE